MTHVENVLGLRHKEGQRLVLSSSHRQLTASQQGWDQRISTRMSSCNEDAGVATSVAVVVPIAMAAGNWNPWPTSRTHQPRRCWIFFSISWAYRGVGYVQVHHGPSTTGVFHCWCGCGMQLQPRGQILGDCLRLRPRLLCSVLNFLEAVPGRPLVPAARVLKASAITNCVSTWFNALHYDLVCSCLHFKIFKGNRNWDSQLWVAWLRWMCICQLEVTWGTNSRTSTSLFGSNPSGAVAVAWESLVAPKWVRSDG